MQTIVITGIGSGIGKALAHIFLEKGFFVIGTSTTGIVDYKHENLFVCQLDLSSSASIKECVETIHRQNKKIDILINNAGVLLDEDETILVPEKLRATLEVNLIGTADFTERMLDALGEHAHLIFISSTAGSLEYAGQLISHHPKHYPAYKISKAALDMYMRTLSIRMKDSGVIVSAVHPGWVKTNIGGPTAMFSPEEAAADICTFAQSSPETGFLWFKGEKLPW